MRWFYHDGSQQVGPVDAATIVALIGSGRVQPGTPVWKEGTPSWTTAAQSELASRFPVPRHAPIQAAPTRVASMAPKKSNTGMAAGTIAAVCVGAVVIITVVAVIAKHAGRMQQAPSGDSVRDEEQAATAHSEITLSPQYAQIVTERFQYIVAPHVREGSQIPADALYVLGFDLGMKFRPRDVDEASVRADHNAAGDIVEQMSGGAVQPVHRHVFLCGCIDGMAAARKDIHPPHAYVRYVALSSLARKLPISMRTGIATSYYAVLHSAPISSNSDDLVTHYVECYRQVGREAGKHAPDPDGTLQRIAYESLFLIYTPERTDMSRDQRIASGFLSGYCESQQAVFGIQMNQQAPIAYPSSRYIGDPASPYNRPITPYSQP